MHVPKIILPSQPMTQKEIVHEPKIIPRLSKIKGKKKTEEEKKAAEKAEEVIVEVHWTQAPVEMEVEVPVPRIQDELFHSVVEVHWTQAPVVEVPAPMIQEELFNSVVEVPVPMIQEELFNSVVEVPVPMIQEELFHSVALGLPLPKAPKSRVAPLFYQGFSARVVTAIVQALSYNYH